MLVFMTTWYPDPQERRIAHAYAVFADAEIKSQLHKGRRVTSGVGYIAAEPHFEPLSDAQLADSADAHKFEPLELINPLDA